MNSKQTHSEKKSIHFNLIDVVIILIVIACVTGVVLRFGIKETQARISDPVNQVTCTFLCPRRNNDLVSVKVGDTLYSDQTGTKLGVVTAVRTVPAINNEKTLSGNYVTVTYNDRSDVYIEVGCNVKKQNDGLYIEGTTLCVVGTQINLRAQSFYCKDAVIADFSAQAE